MEFGERLKSLRTSKKMTQDEVASAIGISRRAYIAYEQENTRPRKKETYNKLAEVLGCDVNYLRIDDTAVGTAGMVAAVAALGTVLGTVGAATPIGMAAAMTTFKGINKGLKNANKTHASMKEKLEESLTYTNDMFLQYEKHQKRFSAIALGVIHKAAAEKGIVCQHGSLKDIDHLGVRPDECIMVSENNIRSWWLIFWAKDKKLDEHIIVFPDDRAGMLLSRFATAEADPHRMSSIIVDDLELYEAISKFKGHNSYRGNLSVILVDTDTVSVVKEEVISTYYEDGECQNTYFTIM